MMHKVAAANHVADKGMDLISKVSAISESLRKLAVDTEQENIDLVASQAGLLEASFDEYKASLLSALKEITTGDGSEISGVDEGDGVRL